MRRLIDILEILFVINVKNMDTLKKCCRHNKIAKKINKLDFEKDIINKQMEIFNVNKKERSS